MNGNDSGSMQVSSREIFTVIFRRKVPIAICAIIVAAAALSAASRTKLNYDATAKVLVRRIGASPLATTWTPFFSLEEEMNTEVELVGTEPVLARALDILNEKGVQYVDPDKKTSRPPTLDDLSGGLTAEPMEMSNIILIKFRGANSRFAREAADAIASAYVEYRVQVRKTSGLEEYFADQLARVESRLLDLTQAQVALKQEGQMFDLEWQQRMAVNKQIELELKLAETRARRIAEQGKLALVKQRLSENPDVLWPFAVNDDNYSLTLFTDYLKVLAERDSRAAYLADSNPEVKMLDDRVALMEKRLRDESSRRIKELEYLVDDLKVDEAAYLKEVQLVEAEMVKPPEQVARVQHLEKEIYYTYLHYDRLLEKLLDTMASEANDIRISNAKVISPATVRMTKAGKMKGVYVAFSIVLGVTLGIGFGFLLENLDHSIKSTTDVEEVVGVPLLGSVPETKDVTGIGGRITNRLKDGS